MRSDGFLLLTAVAWLAPVVCADERSERVSDLRRMQAITEINRVHMELLTATESTLSERRGEYDAANAAAHRAASRNNLAQKRLKEAQKHEAEVFRSLKGKSTTDPEALAAREELAKAQEALACTKESVLGPVRLTSEHRKAVEERDRARASGRESPSVLLGLSHAVAAIESRAVESDEGCVKAERRVKEARAALAELNRRFEDALRVDEGRIAAREALESARREASVTQREAGRTRRAASSAREAMARADVARMSAERRMQESLFVSQQQQYRMADPYRTLPGNWPRQPESPFRRLLRENTK